MTHRRSGDMAAPPPEGQQFSQAVTQRWTSVTPPGVMVNRGMAPYQTVYVPPGSSGLTAGLDRAAP